MEGRPLFAANVALPWPDDPARQAVARGDTAARAPRRRARRGSGGRGYQRPRVQRLPRRRRRGARAISSDAAETTTTTNGSSAADSLAERGLLDADGHADRRRARAQGSHRNCAPTPLALTALTRLDDAAVETVVPDAHADHPTGHRRRRPPCGHPDGPAPRRTRRRLRATCNRSSEVAVPLHPADAAAAVGGLDGHPGPRERADPAVGSDQPNRGVRDERRRSYQPARLQRQARCSPVTWSANVSRRSTACSLDERLAGALHVADADVRNARDAQVDAVQMRAVVEVQRTPHPVHAPPVTHPPGVVALARDRLES